MQNGVQQQGLRCFSRVQLAAIRICVDVVHGLDELDGFHAVANAFTGSVESQLFHKLRGYLRGYRRVSFYISCSLDKFRS